MAFQISYTFKLHDSFSPGLDAISKKMNNFNRSMRNSSFGMRALNNSMQNLQMRSSFLRGQVFDTLATSMATMFPIKQAITFESAMADVNKVMSDIRTPQELKLIGLEVMNLGVDLAQLPKNIAAIYTEGGKLNIPKEKMKDFAAMTEKTSVAWDSTSEVVARTIASISNKLDIPIDQMGRITDAINYLSDNTAAKAQTMIEIVERTAGTFATLEVPDKTITAFAAFADQLEVSPRLAASGLNMMVSRMNKIPALQKMLIKAPEQTIRTVLKALGSMEDKAKRITIIQDIFGEEAGRFVLKATERYELLDDALTKVADDTKFLGSIQKEFNIRMETASKKQEKLLTVMSGWAIQMGDLLLPTYKMLVEGLTSVFLGMIEFNKAFPTMAKFVYGGVAALMALRLSFLVFSFIALQVRLAILGIAFALGSLSIATLTNPFTWLIISGLALIYLFKKLGITWDGFTKKLKLFTADAKRIFSEIGTWIEDNIGSKIYKFIVRPINKAQEALDKLRKIWPFSETEGEQAVKGMANPITGDIPFSYESFLNATGKREPLEITGEININTEGQLTPASNIQIIRGGVKKNLGLNMSASGGGGF